MSELTFALCESADLLPVPCATYSLSPVLTARARSNFERQHMTLRGKSGVFISGFAWNRDNIPLQVISSHACAQSYKHPLSLL